MLLANNKDFEKASIMVDEHLGHTRSSDVIKASLVENDRHLLPEKKKTKPTLWSAHNYQLKLEETVLLSWNISHHYSLQTPTSLVILVMFISKGESLLRITSTPISKTFTRHIQYASQNSFTRHLWFITHVADRKIQPLTSSTVWSLYNYHYYIIIL